MYSRGAIELLLAKTIICGIALDKKMTIESH